MVRRVWISLAALLSCAHSEDSRLAAAERAETRNEETYSLNEADVARIRAQGLDLADQARRIGVTLDAAATAWRNTAATFDAASVEYANAARAYAEAESGYRQVSYAVITAAASDVMLHSVCGPRVSTAQYRRQLKSEGVDLEGKDIDHVIAHARGGPDQPWNYNPLPSSINRSLQEDGLFWKLQNYPLPTIRALAGMALYTLASCS